MIDTAKLDAADSAISAVAAVAHAPEQYYALVRVSDLQSLIATARQAIAYRALIDTHNAGYAEACETRRAKERTSCGCYQRMSVPRTCPDCPRLDMIPVAGIDAAAKEPGA